MPDARLRSVPCNCTVAMMKSFVGVPERPRELSAEHFQQWAQGSSRCTRGDGAGRAAAPKCTCRCRGRVLGADFGGAVPDAGGLELCPDLQIVRLRLRDSPSTPSGQLASNSRTVFSARREEVLSVTAVIATSVNTGPIEVVDTARSSAN